MEIRLTKGAPNRRRGFIMLEALVGIFIVCLVALIYAASMSLGSRSTRMMQNTDQAATMFQHKSDQLRAVGYGRLDGADLLAAGIVDSAGGTTFAFTNADKLATALPSGTGTLSISDATADVKRVTITISWDGGQFKGKKEVLSADVLIAKA